MRTTSTTSTRISRRRRPGNIVARATAFGIPAEEVDGQDVLAVNEVLRRAVARARAGRGRLPSSGEHLPLPRTSRRGRRSRVLPLEGRRGGVEAEPRSDRATRLASRDRGLADTRRARRPGRRCARRDRARRASTPWPRPSRAESEVALTCLRLTPTAPPGVRILTQSQAVNEALRRGAASRSDRLHHRRRRGRGRNAVQGALGAGRGVRAEPRDRLADLRSRDHRHRASARR